MSRKQCHSRLPAKEGAPAATRIEKTCLQMIEFVKKPVTFSNQVRLRDIEEPLSLLSESCSHFFNDLSQISTSILHAIPPEIEHHDAWYPCLYYFQQSTFRWSLHRRKFFYLWSISETSSQRLFLWHGPHGFDWSFLLTCLRPKSMPGFCWRALSNQWASSGFFCTHSTNVSGAVFLRIVHICTSSLTWPHTRWSKRYFRLVATVWTGTNIACKDLVGKAIHQEDKLPGTRPVWTLYLRPRTTPSELIGTGFYLKVHPFRTNNLFCNYMLRSTFLDTRTFKALEVKMEESLEVTDDWWVQWSSTRKQRRSQSIRTILRPRLQHCRSNTSSQWTPQCTLSTTQTTVRLSWSSFGSWCNMFCML